MLLLLFSMPLLPGFYTTQIRVGFRREANFGENNILSTRVAGGCPSLSAHAAHPPYTMATAASCASTRVTATVR